METLRVLCEIFDRFVLFGDDVEILDEFALYLEKMDKKVYICSDISELVQIMEK